MLGNLANLANFKIASRNKRRTNPRKLQGLNHCRYFILAGLDQPCMASTVVWLRLFPAHATVRPDPYGSAEEKTVDCPCFASLPILNALQSRKNLASILSPTSRNSILISFPYCGHHSHLWPHLLGPWRLKILWGPGSH